LTQFFSSKTLGHFLQEYKQLQNNISKRFKLLRKKVQIFMAFVPIGSGSSKKLSALKNSFLNSNECFLRFAPFRWGHREEF